MPSELSKCNPIMLFRLGSVANLRLNARICPLMSGSDETSRGRVVQLLSGSANSWTRCWDPSWRLT
jgi:hypothetical protein